MTVKQLIAKLQKMPPSMKVGICYDSQVCFVPVKAVMKWRPMAYLIDDEAETQVGIFDEVPDEKDGDGRFVR